MFIPESFNNYNTLQKSFLKTKSMSEFVMCIATKNNLFSNKYILREQ